MTSISVNPTQITVDMLKPPTIEVSTGTGGAQGPPGPQGPQGPPGPENNAFAFFNG
jgi:hypothetical protein